MTGRELKTIIFRYLESRGWTNQRPGKLYAWSPKNNPGKRFCWYAAMLVQMGEDETKLLTIPPRIPKPSTVGPEPANL